MEDMVHSVVRDILVGGVLFLLIVIFMILAEDK